MTEEIKQPYTFVTTSFGQTTKGVFKDGKPPASTDDIILELQALASVEVDGVIQGNLIPVFANKDFGAEPFDIQIYSEKRDPPYKTIGYNGVRTFKNVRIEKPISKDDFIHEMIPFTAEEDTGWEEMDFLFEELS